MKKLKKYTKIEDIKLNTLLNKTEVSLLGYGSYIHNSYLSLGKNKWNDNYVVQIDYKVLDYTVTLLYTEYKTFNKAIESIPYLINRAKEEYNLYQSITTQFENLIKKDNYYVYKLKLDKEVDTDRLFQLLNIASLKVLKYVCKYTLDKDIDDPRIVYIDLYTNQINTKY